MSYPTILEVVPGSPAAAAGLVVGDELVAVNGVLPSDVIEYQQLVDEAEVELVVRRSGLDLGLDIVKEPGAPLGLRLNSSIFDRVQTCDNHCEFCFIYQLPPGMRKSLYLKDDDYRLSFLYGNFTTLTRFTELDLARVVEERLGPLYVSIHATDPEVRSGMLRNPRGATSLRWLRALLDHDITVHGQIVLCPTINDGGVLAQTCAEILVRYSRLASVGIVPLGLSRFNQENSLRVHTRAEAQADLDTIHFWQLVAEERLGRRVFFASDELYLTAGRPFPATEAYEAYTQHENGIGMARAFYDELDRLERGTPLLAPEVTGEWRTVPAAPAEGYRAPRLADGANAAGLSSTTDATEAATVVVTGEYGAAVLDPVLDRLQQLAGSPLRLLTVRNDFFGGNVAVSGLLVGDDVRRAIAGDHLPASRYLVPDVALQGGVFLDNVSLDEVAADASVPIRAVPATAGGLVAGARR
jgi:putative radical SAM enzyme (TIGR03279 family)